MDKVETASLRKSEDSFMEYGSTNNLYNSSISICLFSNIEDTHPGISNDVKVLRTSGQAIWGERYHRNVSCPVASFICWWAKIPSADNIGEAIRDGIIAKLKDELYT